MRTHISKLKERVYEANMLLPGHGLVKFTWGNASECDYENNLVVIKPSGVEYESMKPADMVVLNLSTGEKVKGSSDLQPSSDTPTHLLLYRTFCPVGVVHTHSRWATIFAQAQLSIPALGTTHADYFHGEIPCTPLLSPKEISGDYEFKTGVKIAAHVQDHENIPAMLVASHGPFTWGKNAADAAHNAAILEEVAFMAWHSLQLNPALPPMQQELLDKHYLRKHGKNAYYGQ
jgi:L-ribulose-5-phosphate 4-epimerase